MSLQNKFLNFLTSTYDPTFNTVSSNIFKFGEIRTTTYFMLNMVYLFYIGSTLNNTAEV